MGSINWNPAVIDWLSITINYRRITKHYVWNLIRIGQLVQETLMFESVNTCTDGQRSLAILWAHLVSLRLKWANKQTAHNLCVKLWPNSPKIGPRPPKFLLPTYGPISIINRNCEGNIPGVFIIRNSNYAPRRFWGSIQLPLSLYIRPVLVHAATTGQITMKLYENFKYLRWCAHHLHVLIWWFYFSHNNGLSIVHYYLQEIWLYFVSIWQSVDECTFLLISAFQGQDMYEN